MMKINTINDLKDSKLLYEKDMPKFGYFIIGLVFTLCIIIVIWGIIVKKPYVIKTDGVIQSVNKTYISTAYGGEISDFNLREGAYVKKGDKLLRMKSPDIDMQTSQLEQQKQNLNKRIEKYSLLINSIKSNECLFPETDENSLYISQYKMYTSQLKQSQVDIKVLRKQGYKQYEIDNIVKNGNNEQEETKNTAVANAANSRSELEAELNSVNAQLLSLKKGKNDYVIKATTSGFIHMYGEYEKGNTLQAGVSIASISQKKEGEEVVANVSQADRARIHVGDKVNMEVKGLIQSVYGTISGEIKKIDSDYSIDSSGKRYFKLIISLNKNRVSDKKGRTINLDNGMGAECRIIYDEITYAEYVMETLGFITK